MALTAPPLGITHLSLHIDAAGRLVAAEGGRSTTIHPLWLRERSTAPGSVDLDNQQRLYDPCDLDPELSVLSCSTPDATGAVDVAFSDGHTCRYDTAAIRVWLGWAVDPETPPAPIGWDAALGSFPYHDWSSVVAGDPDAMLATLRSFHELGFFVLRGVPVDPGTLEHLVPHFGHLTETNFGRLFDVVSVPNPTDLAYTALHLTAHTDNPYRQPVPGIQILHALVNEAPGGDSTLSDGLAAVRALEAADPEAYRVLCEADVEFRYDTGTDVLVSVEPVIELDRNGTFRRLRFSNRLDFVSSTTPAEQLDAFYRGRRWLRDRLNSPDHQLTFRLEPGDAMVMDNHRLTHGRTAFDPTRGHRHLQGCYLEHEGMDRAWRLAVRAVRAGLDTGGVR